MNFDGSNRYWVAIMSSRKLVIYRRNVSLHFYISLECIHYPQTINKTSKLKKYYHRHIKSLTRVPFKNTSFLKNYIHKRQQKISAKHYIPPSPHTHEQTYNNTQKKEPTLTTPSLQRQIPQFFCSSYPKTYTKPMDDEI